MPWIGNRDVRLVLAAFFFVACVGSVSAANVPSNPTEAAISRCPALLMLETTNDRDYIAVFGAPSPLKTSVTMTFYSSSGAYELDQNNIDIATAYRESGISKYRSAPIIVSDPDKFRFLGASIRFVPESVAATCTPQRQIIESAQATKARIFMSGEVNLRLAIVKELNATPTVSIPEAVSGTIPVSCTVPFQNVALEKAAEPDYPLAARMQGATGTVYISVSLNASGNVTEAHVLRSSGNTPLDLSSLQAARISKYRPGRFLCENEGGAYLYEADFSGHN